MALEDFEMKFFEHLKAEFEATAIGVTSPEADLARKLIAKDPETLTPSDIYALEVLILALQPTERLIQRAPALRAKYQELVGDNIFGRYQPAAFPEDLADQNGRRRLL